MIQIPREDRKMLLRFVKEYNQHSHNDMAESAAKRNIEEGLLELFDPLYFFDIKIPLLEMKRWRQHCSN
ncbi:MAG TPA: hypothetical protein P5056_01655, partial [Candidatus Paceibacterota bacterium]|nr:hypothetical protein [Candidatus Paceibacterota bacterium]